MAISSYSNPIPEIIDGLLRGHQLGLQMQQAARADQEFKTQQAMHNQQMSMQDIMNQHTMEEYGQPLGPGDTIKEHIQTPSTPFASASPAPVSGQEDLYNLPLKQPSPTMPGQSIDYLRKADKSRVATLQDRFGNKTSYETYTPEQRLQRAQSAAEAQNVIKAHGEELLKAAALRAEANQRQIARQNELKLMPGGGISAPAGVEAFGWQEGEKMTRGEAEKLTQDFAAANKPTMMGEGVTALQQIGPWGRTQGAAPAPAAPAVPGQTSINFPFLSQGQPGAAPTPQAQGAPSIPGGFRVVGSTPPKPDDMEKYVQDYLGANTLPDTAANRLKARTARLHDPVAQQQAQSNWEASHALAVGAAADREAARRSTLSNEQRTALDRESTAHSKAFDQISKDADSQLDKILDAEKMIASGAMGQALGVPKVLSALVGGPGSNFRMTQPELDAIYKARGIVGGIQGFFSKIAGQGALNAQQQEQLQSVMGDVRERIMQKKAIARQASDEIMYAPNRPSVLNAVKKGRDALDAYGAQGTQKQGGPQLPTGHKVGDPVTVGGKQYTIGVIHPDGSWDPAPPKGQQSKTVSESELRKRATAQGQNADQAVQAAKQKGYTLVP